MRKLPEDGYSQGNEEFVEEIRRAFADVEYPGDDNLVVTETGEMAEAFKGKHWQEVSTSLAVTYRMNLAGFTPAAYRFYFPAFLIANLTEREGSCIRFFLARPLISSEDEVDFRNFKASFDLFTPGQLEVARKYVESYIENYLDYVRGNEELVEETQRVFTEAQYPGDENIAIPVPINRVSHWESELIAEVFKGKHWKDISTSSVMPHRQNFHQFTPRAFQFYFPAFLIAVLTDSYAGDIDFFLAQTLIPPDEDDKERMQRFKARLDAFTLEQLKVAKKYILSYMEENPIDASVDNTGEKVKRFWNGV